jgi:membrane associated rhomboid family serine protease
VCLERRFRVRLLKSNRFITPIFLHAGIIHFLLNMLAQLTASAEARSLPVVRVYEADVNLQVEKEMGSVGFLVLYFAAGIFGSAIPSVMCYLS